MRLQFWSAIVLFWTTLSVAEAQAPSFYSYVLPDVSVVEGEAFTLAPLPRGGTPLTFEGLKDGQPIPGATGPSYAVSAVKMGDVGAYALKATNAQGEAITNPVPVTVAYLKPPVILNQPRSFAVYPGQRVEALWVKVRGTAPHRYQWKKDGVPIAGGTEAFLRFSALATAADAGIYTVEVSSPAGTTVSQPAKGEVLEPDLPTIAFPFSRKEFPEGEQFSLGVIARGIDPSALRWQKDGVNFFDTGTAFVRDAVPEMAGVYRVFATGTNGTVYSSEMTVVIGPGRRPEISLHPAHFNLRPGESTYLPVSTLTIVPATIQLFRNGQPVYPDPTKFSYYFSGAFLISNAQAADAGQYTVVVTTSTGSVTSDAGIITVDAVPHIISQAPGNRTLGGIDYGTLKVETVVPGATFQWYKDGTPLAGKTTQEIYVGNRADAVGTYTVKVTTPSGDFEMSPPTVVSYRNYGQLPRFESQPAPQVARQEQPVSLFADCVGEQPITYRWQKNGIDIPGAIGAGYYIPNLKPADVGSYRLVATNRLGSMTSDAVTVTLSGPAVPPVITLQPSGRTVVVDTQADELRVDTLEDALTFQWYKNGEPLRSAVGTSMTLWGYQDASGRYSVLVNGPGGSVMSDEVAVTMVGATAPPRFSTQPVPLNQTGYRGQSVTLTSKAVSATGIKGLAYQWRKNGVSIASATQASLTLSNLQVSDAATYSVIATDENGAASSLAVKLEVMAAPAGGFAFPGTYAGTFGGAGYWALQVNDDLSAAFLARLPNGEGVVANNVTVLSSGQFRSGGVTGSLAGGTFLGLFDDKRVPPFTGGRVAETDRFVGPSGFFRATIQPPFYGELSAIVTLDGTMILGVKDPAGNRTVVGQLTNSGGFDMVDAGYSYRGQLGGFAGMVGTYAHGAGAELRFALQDSSGASNTGRLLNLSTRGVSRPGSGVLTAGFVISGNTTKELVIRGIGPGLEQYDVAGHLRNPRLVLRREDGLIASANDDWERTNGSFLGSALVEASARTGAFPLKPGSLDAGLLVTLQPGIYTAQVETSGDSGVALVEVYDSKTGAGGSARLVNMSTRGEVGLGDNILIVGLTVGGEGTRKCLIRVVGPGLRKFEVGGELNDPMLRLFRDQSMLLENDNWSQSTDSATIAFVAKQVGAFDLDAGSKDAAIFVELPPGSYTVLAQGVNNTTGVALVEVYEVP